MSLTRREAGARWSSLLWWPAGIVAWTVTGALIGAFGGGLCGLLAGGLAAVLHADGSQVIAVALHCAGCGGLAGATVGVVGKLVDGTNPFHEADEDADGSLPVVSTLRSSGSSRPDRLARVRKILFARGRLAKEPSSTKRQTPPEIS